MNSIDDSVIRQLFEDYLQMYSSRDDQLTTHFSENFSGFTGGGDFLVKDQQEWVEITRQDFDQIKEPIRIELKDLAVQSLADTVAVATGFFTIHLPIKDQILSNETVRLVLIFRLESEGWKISHSSISAPYHLVREGEIYPMEELGNQNQLLEKLVAERTVQLCDANAKLNQANEKFQQSEALLEATQKMAKVGGWEWNVKHQTMFWTSELYRIHDLYQDEFTQGTMGHIEESLKCYESDDRRVIQEAFEDCIENGKAYDLEFPFHTKTRPDRWIRTIAEPIFENGRIVKVIGNIKDITDHKKTEEDLRKNESLFQRIFDILPIGLWVADKNGKLIKGNSVAVKIWGAELHLGSEEYDVLTARRLPSMEELAPEDWALIHTVNRGVTIREELLEIDAFDGKTKTILNYTAPVLDSSGNIEGAVIVNLDISDRIVLENQLLQSQKMEAIGVLAGGIAHEFNNMLAIIMGNNELLMEDLPQGSLARESTDEIRIAGMRAKDVVKQLLTFSRQDNTVRKVMDLKVTVQESMQLIISSTPVNIKIQQNLSADIYPVMGNDTQINQILINLCNNAVDALPETAGILTIDLCSETIDIQQTKHKTKLKPGQYAKLMVSDNGIGMNAETLARVFEPYFTTKDIGEGTGIGMAVVHGIVERHGGAIIVDSKPSHGTTVTVYLPIYEDLIKQKTEEVDILPGGDEYILYVDDEPSLARLGKRLLESLGYTAESTTDPRKALDMLRGDPHKFDLLITDMAMPNMTGESLILETLKIRQDMPTIICTGYSAAISEKEAAGIGVRSYLMKPIKKSELAVTVRKVLDNPQGSNFIGT